MAEFKEDREILRHFRQTHLPQEDFDLVNFVYHYEHNGCHGAYIAQAKSLGWKTVQGDDPENKEFRNERGQCQVGDVTLMKMPRKRFEQLQREMDNINRLAMGEKSKEQAIEEVNERLSKLVNHNIKAAFEFKDLSELADRKKG